MAEVTEPRHDYTVLARRFRPQAFSEVVGQEHVAQALRNSILQGRVAHAYLFTGARGVGKTSSARILAKSLNCPNAVGPDPCNECEICQGISTGSDVDVLEIDGASNRGIDDIRMLRQNVSVRSMRSKYKVYIIDEVHMLTKDAFNALLKTLEEPPPNVKFIFCTTEPNKIPDTILSRCQRFDFGTIATSSIKMRLSQIADAEGKKVDPEALELVARRAAGSMRDSQSLFDQLLAFGEEHIHAADVHRLLGTAPDERLIAMLDAIIARHQGELLTQFQMALDGGVQLGELTDQLLYYLRDMLIVASGAATVPLQSVADENSAILKRQAATWGLRNILAGMQILADTKGKMKGISYGRALAELALVRLSVLEDLNALENVIAALRSGQFAASGAVPARPISTTSNSSSNVLRPLPLPGTSSAPSGEKKNDAILPKPLVNTTYGTQPVNKQIDVSPPPVVDKAEPEKLRVELVSGGESHFFTQLLTLTPVMMRSNLKNATLSATSGPNQLVLCFEKRYDLARKYLERSDNLNKLREIASDLAGRPIAISFVTAAATSGTEKKDEEPGTSGRKPPVVDAKIKPDPFVLKAAEVFHGRVGDATQM